MIRGELLISFGVHICVASQQQVAEFKLSTCRRFYQGSVASESVDVIKFVNKCTVEDFVSVLRQLTCRS